MKNYDSILPEKVVCPNCNELIELDEVKRKEKVFICPTCNKTNEMITLPDAKHYEEIDTVADENISENENELGPRGVGGWLLFFCITFTILSPLSTIDTLIGGSGSFFPSYPSLKAVTYIDQLIRIGLMAYSIYAGIVLWNVKKDAVKIAKNYLKTYLYCMIFSSILLFVAGLPSSVNILMIAIVIGEVIGTLIYFGICFSYLNKSKRVLATYYKEDKSVLRKYIQEKMRLPEFLICPKCSEELKLDDKERVEMKYQCPWCNEEIDLTELFQFI